MKSVLAQISNFRMEASPIGDCTYFCYVGIPLALIIVCTPLLVLSCVCLGCFLMTRRNNKQKQNEETNDTKEKGSDSDSDDRYVKMSKLPGNIFKPIPPKRRDLEKGAKYENTYAPVLVLTKVQEQRNGNKKGVYYEVMHSAVNT